MAHDKTRNWLWFSYIRHLHQFQLREGDLMWYTSVLKCCADGPWKNVLSLLTEMGNTFLRFDEQLGWNQNVTVPGIFWIIAFFRFCVVTWW